MFTDGFQWWKFCLSRQTVVKGYICRCIVQLVLGIVSQTGPLWWLNSRKKNPVLLGWYGEMSINSYSVCSVLHKLSKINIGRHLTSSLSYCYAHFYWCAWCRTEIKVAIVYKYQAQCPFFLWLDLHLVYLFEYISTTFLYNKFQLFGFKIYVSFVNMQRYYLET